MGGGPQPRLADGGVAGRSARLREALEGETHLLAARGNETVGAAFAALDPDQRSRSAVLAWVAVLPEERGAGVGSALVAGLAGWVGRTGLEAVEGYVAEDDAESLAWAGRRGFAEVSRDSWLALDLRPLEPPPADPPAGVDIVTLAARPELLRGVYEVAGEAYPDIPGHEGEMESFDDWVALDMSGPNDDPEGIFVALAGADVVGYSKFHLPQARPGVAVHDITGVRRAWRGRGIAGALKRAQIAWAKERGYERLETWNETRNTPIRKLNERLGYRLAPGRVLVRGPLFHSARNLLQSE
ncbi:MAG: GNAT family N-acetyltransferase [Gaiellaceae bacterium]